MKRSADSTTDDEKRRKIERQLALVKKVSKQFSDEKFVQLAYVVKMNKTLALAILRMISKAKSAMVKVAHSFFHFFSTGDGEIEMMLKKKFEPTPISKLWWNAYENLGPLGSIGIMAPNLILDDKYEFLQEFYPFDRKDKQQLRNAQWTYARNLLAFVFDYRFTAETVKINFSYGDIVNEHSLLMIFETNSSVTAILTMSYPEGKNIDNDITVTTDTLIITYGDDRGWITTPMAKHSVIHGHVDHWIEYEKLPADDKGTERRSFRMTFYPTDSPQRRDILLGLLNFTIGERDTWEFKFNSPTLYEMTHEQRKKYEDDIYDPENPDIEPSEFAEDYLDKSDFSTAALERARLNDFPFISVFALLLMGAGNWGDLSRWVDKMGYIEYDKKEIISPDTNNIFRSKVPIDDPKKIGGHQYRYFSNPKIFAMFIHKADVMDGIPAIGEFWWRDYYILKRSGSYPHFPKKYRYESNPLTIIAHQLAK